jgi:hypothetical protein
MSDDELIRPHDPFSGHETPPAVDDTAEPEKAQEEQPPPAEPAKSETPPPAPEKKVAPKRRAAPRRRRVSKADADAAAKKVGK